MGCGCKNKNNTNTQQTQQVQPSTVTTEQKTTQNSVQDVIKKTIEKYYTKKS